MIAVGLDLSLTSTGMAWIDEDGGLGVHKVTSTGRKNDSVARTAGRLMTLAGEIVSRVLELSPDVVVVESATFSTRADTSAHRRAGLWWLVVVTLLDAGMSVVTVTPSQVKKFATGRGNASKALVVAAAVKYWGLETFSSDDEADAAFLAAMGAYNEGVLLPFARSQWRDALVTSAFGDEVYADSSRSRPRAGDG